MSRLNGSKSSGELILIVGPMKSGKSWDLISRVDPLFYSDIPWSAFMPAANTRDKTIWSRLGKTGIQISPAKVRKVESLECALKEDDEVIAIDEVHMFSPDQSKFFDKLLKQGRQIIAAGLDMDYRGIVYEIIIGLLSLGPSEVKCHAAVCDVCRKPNARFTQILYNDQPVLEGLPSVIPDDKSHQYKYQARCRTHFARKQ
jgi:thymidine kinase